MQCCEFEMVLAYMRMWTAQCVLEHHYHRLELADVLMDHGVTTMDKLPEVDALEPNLERQMRSVA
jgi:hypothetical protein